MKKFVRRTFILMLLACVLVTGYVPAAGAATDTRNHWAEPVIADWLDKGLIDGYEDGTFRPDHSITRAEIAALINRKFKIAPAKEGVTFPDLSRQGWQYGPLSAAAAAGYLHGYEDGTIGPDKAVTRQELAVIIKGLLKLEAVKEDASFTDSAKFPAWSRNDIAAVAAKGIMEGYADGTFAPTRTVTRAEAVVTLDRGARIQKQTEPLVYSSAGVYGPENGNETVNRDVTVNVKGVTLRNMTITGNVLLGEGIGEGDVTLQNVTVRGKTTVKGGGANSIHFENSTLAVIIVAKEKGEVRIVARGATSVQAVEVLSAVKIEEEQIVGTGFSDIVLRSDLAEGTIIKLIGNFNKVVVSSKKTKVQLDKGTIDELNIAQGATDNQISLGAQSVVKELVANATSQILGQGTIEKATLSEAAEATTFETKPTNLNGESTNVTNSGGGGGPVGGSSQAQSEPLSIQAAAVGYKKLEVTFSQAVEPSTTEIVLQNSTIEVEQMSYSDDHKKVTILLKSALTEGTYSIQINRRLSEGLKSTTQSITVENERVTDFTYLLDSAIWDFKDPAHVKVKFKLTNQYGEDATSRYSNDVKLSFLPDQASSTHPVPENGLATLQFFRALTENERVFIFVFYGNDIKLKKELVVSKDEIPATSQGIPFTLPSIELKGLYHPENKRLTVDSNFSEFSILLRWEGETALIPKNFSTFVSNGNVLGVKQNTEGPDFGTVTLGDESWSTLTLTKGNSPVPGLVLITLFDKKNYFWKDIMVTVYPNTPTPPEAEAVFVTGDQLIAKYNTAADYSKASWTIKDSVTQVVYQAQYAESNADIGIFTIQGGVAPSGYYTAATAGSSTEYDAIVAGTETVNGAVYGKVYYNGPKKVMTVINATYLDQSASGPLNIAPLASNDVMQVFYENQLMLKAIWDGQKWVFNEIVKDPVAPPANVNATPLSNRQIRLSWAPVENADHYNIYYNPAETGEFIPLKDAQGNAVKVKDAVYIDDSLSPHTTRAYFVKAALSGPNWEVESKPSVTVTATTYYNEHIALDFLVADSVQHPTEPILYLTDKQNKKLHAINYETGEKTSLSLPLPPESVTFAAGKVYVSLLKGEHSSYLYDADQKGAVAVVDAVSLHLDKTFDINLDPYDIAVDRSGYIYIASGSGQWTSIKSYSPTVYQEVAHSMIRQASYIQMHPALNRIYAINTDTSPRDMEVFNVSNGAFTPAGYNSPYHGDYKMSTNMRVSPDGKYIFNGAGTVFRASETKSDDMKYVYSLNKGFSDIAFELNDDRFYTAKDGLAGAYRYADFVQYGQYHTDGETQSLYNSAERLLAISKFGANHVIELIEKNAMESIPPAETPGIYLHGTVTDIVYAAAGQKAYALDEAFNKLYVVDLASSKVERTVPLTYRPSELTLSEDGSKLYIRNNDANVLVTEISLNDFGQRHLSYQAPSDYSDPAHGQIYQKGNKLYVVTGEWAPRLLLFDATTFTKINYGTEISSIGDIVFSSDNSKLYYWYQYGWSAGSAETDVYEVTIGATTLTQSGKSQIGYPEFKRDPLDTPIFLLEDRDLVIAKNRVLNRNNLNETVAVLPEPIYAVSPDGSTLVGKNGLYAAHTYQKIQSLSLSGASHFFYANGTLYYFIGNTLQHL